ncbi:MAG: tetratricopeptide repeat protein, partial [Bryobacteraceae bacterium]
EQVLAAVSAGNPAARERNQRMFYADLYIALYHEAAGRGSEAAKYMTRAAAYPADNYMADVARVHAARLTRGTR